MKIHFNYEMRMALIVANAVAEEVVNNTTYGHPFGERRQCESRPVLFSVRGKNVPVFHYEGGTVIKVHLLKLRDEQHDWCMVTHVEIRYYQRDSVSCIAEKKKTSVTWGSDNLLKLKESRWWWHPHVVRREILES